jgi:hypothetical protein
MEYELKDNQKHIEADILEEQPKEANTSYTERDLSLRAVPAVDIAIRDVSVTLRSNPAVRPLSLLLRRKQATEGVDATSTDKKILNGTSADFPSGTLTGNT